MSDPSLTTLPEDEYLEKYEKDVSNPPWYDRYLGIKPKAYWVGGERNEIVVMEGYDTPQRIAHEYAHSQGMKHPKKTSVAYWIDVEGASPLRITDMNDWILKTREWYKDIR